jgi:predicted DNA-binding transcriptional regulator AlpA
MESEMVSMRVYRLRQLATTKNRQGVLPVGPATVWRWVRDGKFPAPFKLGQGTTVWDAAQVEAFIVSASAGKGGAA